MKLIVMKRDQEGDILITLSFYTALQASIGILVKFKYCRKNISVPTKHEYKILLIETNWKFYKTNAVEYIFRHIHRKHGSKE